MTKYPNAIDDNTSLPPVTPGSGIATPVGPAGGDLGGTYPNPFVTGIQNNPVPSPSGTNTVLTWTGSALAWNTGGGGGGGGGGNVFVYRDSAPSPSGNVFSTWATAYAAASAAKGFRVIEIDDSLNSCIVPAGAYNLLDIKLLGIVKPSTPVLNISDGVTFANFRDGENVNLSMNNTSAPIETLTGGSDLVILRNCNIFTGSGTAPFWSLTSGSTLVVEMFDNSSISYTNGISIDATSVCVTILTAISTLGNNVVSGPTGAFLDVILDDSSTFGAQSAFSGTLSSSPESNISQITGLNSSGGIIKLGDGNHDLSFNMVASNVNPGTALNFTGSNALNGSSNAGNITITAGANTFGSGGANGGNININGGATTANGSGGQINLTSGNGSQGGFINITSGNGNGNSGGNITILAGTDTSSNGGNISITGGTGSAGGNLTLASGTGQGNNGGNIFITAGTDTGGATGGEITIMSGGSTAGQPAGRIFIIPGAGTAGSYYADVRLYSVPQNASGNQDLMLEVVDFASQTRRVVALCQTGNNVTGITPTDVPSGDGVVWIGKAQTNPSSHGTTGGVLYVDHTTGALHYLGPSGTNTQIAPA